MENRIYKNSLGLITLIHLGVSHWQGTVANLSTAIIALSLVGLIAVFRYFEHNSLPDMRKEFAEFKAACKGDMSSFKVDMNTEVGGRLNSFESSLSKYDAFIIKNPSIGAKSIRF